MSEVQSRELRQETKKGSMTRSSIDVVTKLVPAVVAATYFYGFLVLTSHLGDFGITTAGILDASYFVAGSTFMYLIAVYTVFVFRPLRGLDSLIRVGPEVMSKHPTPTSLETVWFLPYLAIQLCVHPCIAALIFSSILFDTTQIASWIIPALVAVVLFSGYLKGRIGYRVWDYYLMSVLRIAIIILFVIIATRETWMIIGFLGGMSALFGYARHEFHNRRNSPERQAYLAGFCAIMLIAIAMLFGDVTYGSIKRSYGGGAPVSIAISLNQSQVRDDEIISESTIMADVVHVSDTDLYLVLADSQHMVLSRSAVLWIRLLDPE